MTGERLEVQRTIAADPAAIFRVLCDPQGHVAIDSTGMLMDATGDPVTAAGDTFVVHMDREALNDYPMGRYDRTGGTPVFSRSCRQERCGPRSGSWPAPWPGAPSPEHQSYLQAYNASKHPRPARGPAA